MTGAVSRRGLAVVLTAIFAITLSACGGGGGGAASSSTPTNKPVAANARVIPVTARSFAFDPDSIVVRAGENVAIQLHALDAYHTFTVEGIGTIVSANAGSTRTGGLRLDRPGRYTFFCSVPGHRAAGMQGTINVTP